MVLEFNNKTELAEILGIIEHFEYSKSSQLIQPQRKNSDGNDIDEFSFYLASALTSYTLAYLFPVFLDLHTLKA